jgi:hypothetical protein
MLRQWSSPLWTCATKCCFRACATPACRAFQASAQLEQSFQESVTEKIESEFERDAKAAAQAVAALNSTNRARVLEALLESTEAPGSPRYLHQLLKDADKNRDGVLDTCVHCYSREQRCMCTPGVRHAYVRTGAGPVSCGANASKRWMLHVVAQFKAGRHCKLIVAASHAGRSLRQRCGSIRLRKRTRAWISHRGTS